MYDMLHRALAGSESSHSDFADHSRRRSPAQSIKHSAGQYKVIEEKAFGISEVSTTTTL
jgi:hypothetical protein